MKKLTKSERKFLAQIPDKKEYKLSIGRISLFFLPVILLGLGLIIFWDNSIYNILGVIFLLSLPLILISINHLYRSPIYKIYFDTAKRSVKITYFNKEQIIMYEEIKTLEVVMATSFRNPLSFFEYAVLHLRNHQRIYISCLLINPNTFVRFGAFKQYKQRIVGAPIMWDN